LLVVETPALASSDNTSDKTISKWVHYKNVDYQIQISYPPTWKTLENYAGSIVAVYAPPDSPDDQFAENLNIVCEDISSFPELTLEHYSEKGKEILAKMLTNFSLIKSESTTISNINARTLTFTARQGIYRLKFKQTSLIANKRAYVITFSAEEKRFAKYENTGASIINSFRIFTPTLFQSL
jgi:serine/threonine-protein kinase